MALETSGFQLSQFDRAPSIPGNIGVVDTKSIYDSVTSALKQHESFRTLQQVQGLNDATTAYQTAQAQGLLSNLPDTLAADRAKSQLFSASAPYEQSLLQPRAQAERSKLSYETALSGELNKPENITAIARSKTLSSGARGVYDLAKIAADPNADPQARNAAGIKLKTIQDANQRFTSALASGKVDFHSTNSDGSTYVRFRDGSTGIIGYPDTYTGNTAAYLTGPISMTRGAIVPPSDAAPATVGETSFAPAPGLLSSSATEDFSALGARGPIPLAATKQAALDAQTQAKSLAKHGEGNSGSAVDFAQGDEAKTSLRSYFNDELKDASKALDVQRTHLNQWVALQKEDAITGAVVDRIRKSVEESGYLNTGGGYLPEKFREWANTNAVFIEAMNNLKSRNTLGNMLKLKAASATGASGMGQLSNEEGVILRDSLASLQGGKLSPSQMIAVLDRLKVDMASQAAAAKQTIESQISQQNSRGWRASIGGYGNPEIAIRAGFTSPAPTSSSAAPQPSTEQLSFQRSGSLAPSALTFRSPEAPENRFSKLTAGSDITSELDETGDDDSGVPRIKVVSDSASAPVAAPVADAEPVAVDPSPPPPPPPPSGDSYLPEAIAGGAMAAPSILKAVPAIQKLAGQGAEYVRQGVNYVKDAATRSGQLRNAGERLLSSMGPGAIARKAVPALGLGYTAGSLANKLIPTIMDAGGFINTKEVYGNKTPHLSELLADWYRTNTGAYGAEQSPERTYGDRWADAYRAIWAAKKLTPDQRAKALADLAKTRENWKASGINLSDLVTKIASKPSDQATSEPEDYSSSGQSFKVESTPERMLGGEQLNRLRLKRDGKTSTAPAPDAAISKERLAKALPDPLTFSPETAEDMRKLLEEYDAAQRGESVPERVLGREQLDRLRLKNGGVR